MNVKVKNKKKQKEQKQKLCDQRVSIDIQVK